jgi:hypothetical protein
MKNDCNCDDMKKKCCDGDNKECCGEKSNLDEMPKEDLLAKKTRLEESLKEVDEALTKAE